MLFMIFVLWVVSVLMFSMSRFRGDPRLMYLTPHTTKAQWEAWGKEMGLDKPLVVQYGVRVQFSPPRPFIEPPNEISP